MPDNKVYPGQVWGDARGNGFGRELLVEAINDRHAFLRDAEGRKTRILIRRLTGGVVYYLMSEAPARYIDVPSESEPGKVYHVWTGDVFSPAHCTCENFRWATREPGKAYRCKHLRKVLKEM